MILLNINSLCGEPMNDGHQLQCQEVFVLELFQFCYHQHILYFHTLFMQEAKALAGLHECSYSKPRMSHRCSPMR